MKDLAVLVPSRGRPENIVRLRDAFAKTCTSDISLHVYVDSDDPKLLDYSNIDGIHLYVGKPSRIGPILNNAAPVLSEGSFAVGFMGDDHLPRTEGWDYIMLTKLKQTGTGVAYGNDLLQGEGLPTAVIMTSDIVKSLGYFSLPGGQHLFLDNFWMAIGRGIDRLFYFNDVIIEHLHPVAQKTTWDDTYAKANSGETWDADEAAFNTYMSEQYQKDIEKLKNELGLS